MTNPTPSEENAASSAAADPAPPEISISDRVPFKQKVSYALGSLVEAFAGGSLGPMFMPVFNVGFGISPGLLGIVGMIHRVWDAIYDPIIANVSDNTRTRWGRRRPFILIGSIATAIVTPLMWRLGDGWSEMTMLVYITLIGLLVHVCMSTWAMPYNSLMLELTPNYDERTRVSAYRAIVGKLGALIGAWVLPICASKWLFPNPTTGEADLVRGIQTVSIGLSVGIVIFGMLPALFVTERYYARDASKQAKEPFFKGLRDSFQLRPLWMLIFIVLFQVLGNALVGGMGFYLNMYFVNKGQLSDAAFIEGLKSSVAFVTGLAAVPFWTWVSEKLDKKWTLMIIIASGLISSALQYMCLSPRYPYLQIIPAVFYASVVASIWLILPSMQADIVDYDELRTHRRREGNINAVFTWFFKLGVTLATGASGFILMWTGFDVKNGSHQAPEVLHLMLVLFIAVPAVFWSIAVVILWFYPLNREKMAVIRAQLEARRGKV